MWDAVKGKAIHGIGQKPNDESLVESRSLLPEAYTLSHAFLWDLSELMTVTTHLAIVSSTLPMGLCI